MDRVRLIVANLSKLRPRLFFFLLPLLTLTRLDKILHVKFTRHWYLLHRNYEEKKGSVSPRWIFHHRICRYSTRWLHRVYCYVLMYLYLSKTVGTILSEVFLALTILVMKSFQFTVNCGCRCSHHDDDANKRQVVAKVKTSYCLPSAVRVKVYKFHDQ